MKNINFIVCLLLFCTSSKNFAQENNPFLSSKDNDDIVITWNKNTPEDEIKDDVKALMDKGITIKYSNVKRNSKNEITGLKMEYSDRKGNKGKLELDNTTPIPRIKFFKQGETIGFGEPLNENNFFGGNPMLNGFADVEDLIKQFKFNSTDGDLQSFNFTFPNNGENFSNSKSQLRIHKEGKKPLVIENGEIIEGGEDYNQHELKKIKEEHKIEEFEYKNQDLNGVEFDFRNQEGLDAFKKKINEMKIEMEQKFQSNKIQPNNWDLEKTTQDFLKAKDELNNARKELELAKKELEQAKLNSSKGK